MIKRRSFGTHPRRDFSKIPPFIEVPYLLGIQTSSYDRFLQRGVPQSERENLGLEAVFHSVFPIQDFKGIAALEFVRYTIGEPKYSADECRERGMTLSAPLKVTIRLVLYQKDAAGKKSVKDMKEQEVYFGELPLMTPTGTFIINGTERVVVSQMHKSPGVFFDSEKSKTGPVVRTLYAARMIPYRGSWLDFEFDAKDYLYARIDRRRKFLATTFLQAMGFTRQEILDTFYRRETVTQAESGAFTKRLDPELHQGHKLRRGIVHPKTRRGPRQGGAQAHGSPAQEAQGERGRGRSPSLPRSWPGRSPPAKSRTRRRVRCCSRATWLSARATSRRSAKRASASSSCSRSTACTPPATCATRSRRTASARRAEALVEIYKKMRPGEPPTLETSRVFFENLFFNPKRYDLSPVGRMKLTTKLSLQDKIGLDVRVLTRDDIIETLRRLIKINAGQGRPDDVDHLGNRRVKSIGELLENQFRIGLVRMERALKERMAVQEVETLMPHDLVNARPVDAAIKEFFGSSQLSQFMDQTNPARRDHPQAPSLGARPRRSDPRARRVRGARRAPDPLRPGLPDRDARGPEHRADHLALDVRPGQRVRLHRDALPHGQGREGHRPGALPDGRRGGPVRHRPGEHGARRRGEIHLPEGFGAPQRRVRTRAARGNRDDGRLAEADRFGGHGPDTVSRARRRQPGADGFEHAAPGGAPARARGAARRAPASRASPPATPASRSRRPATASSRRSTPTGSSCAARPRRTTPPGVSRSSTSSSTAARTRTPASTRCRSSARGRS